MMAANPRSRRVAEQLQRYLSSHALPALRDPRLGFLTVTAVEVSPDLREARVFVSIFEADGSKRRASLEVLNGASATLRRAVAQGLRLRFAPVLSFVEDETLERADRLESIFRSLPGEASDDESE